MKRSITANYLYNMMYEILALIVPLITTPYVSRVLGATAIGDYGFTSGIVSYFGIIAVTGTVNFAKREIAYNQDNKYKRSILFYEVFLFRTIFTACMLVAYIGFIFIFGYEYRVLYTIQILTVLSWLVDISWFYQGMENFKVTAIRNCVVKIVGTILIFVLVKQQEDLWLYVLILSGTTLAGNLTMWVYLKQYIIKVNWKDVKIFEYTREIFSLFISVIAIQVYTILDQTMLGIIGNTTEVGYYTQAQKIIKMALMVISAFTAVLMPRISSLCGEGKNDEVELYIKRSIGFLLMLSLPMMVGCFLVAERFVPIFFGSGYDPVVQLMQVLSLLFVILGAGQVFGTMLISLKKQRAYNFCVTAGALINFLLNMLLIGKLYALGAAIASVVAEGIVTSLEMHNINKVYKLKKYIRIIPNYLIPSIFMGVVIYICTSIFPADAVFLFLTILIGVLVYFGILAIRKDELFSELLKKGLTVIKIQRK
ncbi:MAG: flippase [Clostridiales bacterium]|nr:flippase [Clostridiales bacterium]